MDFVGLLVLAALPFVNWPITILLVRLALRRPTICALNERAGLAILISTVTTVYAAVSINFHAAVIDFDVARTVIRGSIVVLGLYPLVWVWAYWSNKFHDPELGQADLDADDAAGELGQGGEGPVIEVDQPFPVGPAVALAPTLDTSETIEGRWSDEP